jgi:hypothetical protein
MRIFYRCALDSRKMFPLRSSRTVSEKAMLDQPIPVQAAQVKCEVIEYNGHLALRFHGEFFPSLLGVFFGFTVSSETTRADAEALAEQLNRHCGHMLAGFMDHAGLTEAEHLALVEMYDDMGLLDPNLDELKARCAPACPLPAVAAE